MLKKKNITKKMLFVKVAEELQPILNLNDWKISLLFSKSERMRDNATCEAFTEYKFAKITVNQPEMKHLTHAEIVSIVIHEMVHCVLWELGDWAHTLSEGDRHKLKTSRKYEESAVTKFEHIILGLVGPIINQRLDNLGYNKINFTLPKFEYFQTNGEE